MTSWPTLHLLIVELSGLVLGDPYPNQIARDVVLTRQAGERNFTTQVLLRHLAFELKTVTATTTGHTLVLLARKPTGKVTPSNCPVGGVHSNNWGKLLQH